MKDVIRQFGIIVLAAMIGFSMASCGSGADNDGGDGDLGGVISRPPAVPGGPCGVYSPVTGGDAGKLYISNTDVFTITGPNNAGTVSTATYGNTANIKARISYNTGGSNSYYELAAGVVSGGQLNILVPRPAETYLGTVVNSIAYIPVDFIKSGHNTKVGILWIYDDIAFREYFSIAAVNPVFTMGGDGQWFQQSGEAYQYYYSNGEATISGITSSGGYTIIVSIKLAEGWNSVCTIDNASTNTTTIISKNPPNSAKWVHAMPPN